MQGQNFDCIKSIFVSKTNTVWNVDIENVFFWNVVEMFHEGAHYVGVNHYDHLVTFLHARHNPTIV